MRQVGAALIDNLSSQTQPSSSLLLRIREYRSPASRAQPKAFVLIQVAPCGAPCPLPLLRAQKSQAYDPALHASKFPAGSAGGRNRRLQEISAISISIGGPPL